MAGRLGYCSRDQTRVPLQGDEIRPCWESPLQVGPFEGLFLGLSVPAASGSGSAHEATEPGLADSRLAPPPVTIEVSRSASDQGLIEAPHVPARDVPVQVIRSQGSRPGPTRP